MPRLSLIPDLWADRAAQLARLAVAMPRIPTIDALEERAFLLGALVPEAGYVPDPESLDWPLVLKLGHRFALDHVLCQRIRQREQVSLLPNGAWAELEERSDHAEVQNRFLIADAQRIAAALDAAGIEHVFMKGTALLARHGETLAGRHTDDIDLLIRPDRLPRVQACLEGLGFVAESRAYNHLRHPLIMNSPLGTACEVHVALDPMLEPAMWAEREVVSGLTIPSADVLLEHLCHHVIVQHAPAPRYLPRHIVDVGTLMRLDGEPVGGSAAVRTSVELVKLVEELTDSRASAMALASIVFPRLQTGLHGVYAHLKGGPLKSGIRDLRTELRALTRLPRQLLVDVA